MIETARLYLYAFGLLTIAGGALGYAKARSGPSLVAGGVFGALLLLAGYLVGRGGSLGLWIGFGVSAMLAGRFSTAFRRNRKVMPAGIMTLLGFAGIAISLLALGR